MFTKCKLLANLTHIYGWRLMHHLKRIQVIMKPVNIGYSVYAKRNILDMKHVI